MNKSQFINTLKDKLKRYDTKEVDDAVSYYDELIMDMMSDGKSEEEAVISLGSINSIVSEINGNLIKKTNTKGILASISIILGICLSPALLPLAIVLIVMYFILFVIAFALIVSFGAATIATLGGSILVFFTPNSIGSNILSCAICLLVSVIMASITYYVTKYSVIIIRYVTIKMSALINTLTKKGDKK